MATSAASDPLVPAYKKIREALRGRIRDGAYRVGDRLPSESELSREFGVARMTVRQALAQLAFENLIVAQTGRGSFVTARQNVEAMIDATSKLSFEEQISAQGKKSTLKLLSFDAIAAPAEVAERLGLPVTSPVYRLERLRYVDEQLVGLEIRHLRQDVGERVRASGLNTMSTFALVEAALGESLGIVDVSMFASAAAKDVAEKLGVRKGAPVLIREHVVFDSGGKSVLCGNSIYRGNLRMRFAYPRQSAKR